MPVISYFVDESWISYEFWRVQILQPPTLDHWLLYNGTQNLNWTISRFNVVWQPIKRRKRFTCIEPMEWNQLMFHRIVCRSYWLPFNPLCIPSGSFTVQK